MVDAVSPPLIPTCLVGAVIRLDPLTERDAPALATVGAEGQLFTSTVTTVPGTVESAQAYVAEALAGQAAGRYLPFVIRLQTTGEVVGTTRFRAIALQHRRVEIGSTFLGLRVQRTAVNTEAKFLLLQHAFETWGCNRVEFLTDRLNTQSRAAILRLGATEEGILRQHMVMPDGRLRDSVIFSILLPEWPSIKTTLQAALQRPQSP
jgi:RimJ/RimL family protein N-acetyltransferase